MFIINDYTREHIHSPRSRAKGYVERDYSKHPVEMFAPPEEIPLIPRSEWQARIQERKEQKSGLKDLWLRYFRSKNVDPDIAHLDQNGQGFCWAYSCGHALMATMVRDNQEVRRLSPHAVACKIKNFKDEGGWCGLSAQFVRKNGMPTVATWKEKSMSRSNDTDATCEEAAKLKITEDYVDLTIDVWGQNLTYDQVITCLLMNIPVQVDFNWWGHSVCGMDVDWVDGEAVPIILNSWQGWGEFGFATLQGKRAIPDGAVATRTVIVS